jgi:hypothetical protein
VDRIALVCELTPWTPFHDIVGVQRIYVMLGAVLGGRENGGTKVAQKK